MNIPFKALAIGLIYFIGFGQDLCCSEDTKEREEARKAYDLRESGRDIWEEEYVSYQRSLGQEPVPSLEDIAREALSNAAQTTKLSPLDYFRWQEQQRAKKLHLRIQAAKSSRNFIRTQNS